MGWLWTIQLIVDVLLIAAIWKLYDERRRLRHPANASAEESLQAEDFERYHEALSDLCLKMRRESEQCMAQLEQKTRVARQVMRHFEDLPLTEVSLRSVTPAPVQQEPSPASVRRSGESLQAREEVLYLHSQGYTVEQIARRMQLGQREVQLMLSLQSRRS